MSVRLEQQMKDVDMSVGEISAVGLRFAEDDGCTYHSTQCSLVFQTSQAVLADEVKSRMEHQ